MVVSALPKYAVFKNMYNSTYLSFRNDDKYLSFTGNDVRSPEAKFAIEPASSGNGQVHVRSCCNNEYLVRNSSEFIIAGAAEHDQDTTQETCTLLEPLAVNDGDTTTIRFRHVQSGNYACLNYSGDASNVDDACLHAVSQSPNDYLMDAYEVIDWETLPQYTVVSALPQYAVFKNKFNSKILSFRKEDTYVSFSGENVRIPEAKFVIEPASSGNGQVHVRSACNNKYLVRTGYYYCFKADAAEHDEDTTRETCTLLEPHTVYDGDTGTIRFYHVQSGNYACLNYTGDASNGLDACLYAVSQSPNDYLMDAYEVIDWETLPQENTVVLPLPRYAAFKNKFNSIFLSYRKNDRFLQFSADNLLSSDTKFAIEPESSGNGQVHVRSCYNNKYLVRTGQFFIADAAKPDEDTTKETCTLLEPVLVNDGVTTTIRLRHVQSGNYACLYYSGDASNVHDACLYAVSQSPNDYLMDAYEVVDWEKLVIFPSHNIAFKGRNNSYLGGIWAESHQYLQFAADDKNQENTSYRVEPVGEESVQIYSNYFSSYWSYNDSWIWADRTQKSPNDPNALFQPVKLGGNIIALRSLGNNKFLRGLDTDRKTRCLNAWAQTITDDCHLTVEELVISRSIYNIVYRQEDARVYNETPIVCGRGAATNNSNGSDTLQIPIKYTETRSTSWENSVSLEVGLTTTFEAGVPFIAEGGIEFSVTATGGHTWGGTKEDSFETGTTYTATIGPKTHVEVSYVATKGTCDIPFSYTQADTFSDGSHKTTVKDDGMYTGVNYYNFSFDKKETAL